MAEPAFSFTLPSVEDDMTLDCRLYHPKILSSQLSARHSIVKGAILAHPYAPLGGCYDDGVILSLTETLLEQGFIVGTFNFRGAGSSQGKTSWSGRPETEDFVTIAGFLIYHLYYLDESTDSGRDPEIKDPRRLHLLLGGYSYGSLVVARLPLITNITDRFQLASLGTTRAEIIMRARTLAKQTLQSVRESQDSSKRRGKGLRLGDTATSPTAPHSRSSLVVMGGEETEPSERRRSRDSHNSADFVRKSVEMPTRAMHHIRSGSEESNLAKEIPCRENRTSSDGGGLNAPRVDVSYLLVSPVLLPFSTQLLPPGPPMPPFGLKRREPDGNPGALFRQKPTLAVFGTKDGFTSSRRLRTWAEKVEKESTNSSFVWKQIEGAGHFWREQGAMKALQDQLISWISKLS